MENKKLLPFLISNKIKSCLIIHWWIRNLLFSDSKKVFLLSDFLIQWNVLVLLFFSPQRSVKKLLDIYNQERYEVQRPCKYLRHFDLLICIQCAQYVFSPFHSRTRLLCLLVFRYLQEPNWSETSRDNWCLLSSSLQ